MCCADIPVVNYTLMVLTLIIVIAFKTSARLSLAYGAPPVIFAFLLPFLYVWVAFPTG